jgi:hypothetical protein
MIILWAVTGAALAAAVAAWIAARRAKARLAQLSDMYWELKYQHLELRKQVERLQGTDAPAAPTPAPPPPKETFVPLTSLRR